MDVSKYKSQPQEHFSSPHEVVSHKELSTQEKIDILESWRQEIMQLIVAEEENMPAQEDDHYHDEEKQLSEIHQLLTDLKKD